MDPAMTSGHSCASLLEHFVGSTVLYQKQTFSNLLEHFMGPAMTSQHSCASLGLSNPRTTHRINLKYCSTRSGRHQMAHARLIEIKNTYYSKLFVFFCLCLYILAEKAFKDDWFNKQHNLNITKSDLVELLNIATKNQLFQFKRCLYEQTDGVAMGSPIGPLMANAFMCSIEDRLQDQGKLPEFYKRYVDDTLSIMPNVETAESFLSSLNESHPSVSFTMELGEHGKLPWERRSGNAMVAWRQGCTENQLKPDYYYITRATSTLDTRSHC